MSQTDFQNSGEDEWDGGPKNHFRNLGEGTIQRRSEIHFQKLGEDEWDGCPTIHFQKLGGGTFNEGPKFIFKIKGRTNEAEVQKFIFKLWGEGKSTEVWNSFSKFRGGRMRLRSVFAQSGSSWIQNHLLLIYHLSNHHVTAPDWWFKVFFFDIGLQSYIQYASLQN